MPFDAKRDRADRLRELTADRPSHRRLLEILLALEVDQNGEDEQLAAGAMAESSRLSSTAALALIEDTNWIRHYQPRGYMIFPNQYAEYRRRSAAAYRARTRTMTRRATEGTLADLLRFDQ